MITRIHRRIGAVGACLAALLAATAGDAATPPPPTPTPAAAAPETPAAQLLPAVARRCVGQYSDTLLALSPAVTGYEREPGHSFVYCLRNTATYEQVYYGRDGKLRKRFIKAVSHGTGFAYRWSGSETLLLTNHHVATWPEVTDEENAVKGVPGGARKVGETVQIVRNDDDDYEPGFINLTRAATDPSLDATVLRTPRRLNVMPYKVGSSAALKTGNALEVRGYPLGAFAAANVGKVTNPYVEDAEGTWSHADVALDALVNRGNSGSPVLAVSCLTGEYELVGLFHAGYREGEAMNLAVGVDELRPLMERLSVRPGKTVPLTGAALTPETRTLLAAMLSSEVPVTEMRFGRRTVRVTLTHDDKFSFKVFGPDYPFDPFVFIQLDEPVAEDDEPPRVVVSRALEPSHVVPPDALNGEAREHLQRVVAAVMLRLAQVQQYRDTAGEPPRAPAAHRRAERLLREMARAEKEQEDLLGVLDSLLERARAHQQADTPAAATAPREEAAVEPGGGGDLGGESGVLSP